MDYCNSLLVGLPNGLLDRIQRAQNCAARIVLKQRKYDHAKPMLRQLHWLPIRARIEYKIAILCYRCLHGLAPAYLSDLLAVYTPTRSLRSAKEGYLVVPRVRLETFGKRSFASAAPSVWNALPQTLRDCQTLTSFKCSLKTYLFQRHLGDNELAWLG